MPDQFIILLRNEITKAAGRKLPYFGLLAVGLVCVAVYFIAGQSGETAAANAWGYVGFSMQLAFTDVGPVCLVAFAALLVAEEIGTGTIRSALAAPVQRWELYLAKSVTGLLYLVALSVVGLLFSVALAATRYHFTAVTDSFGVVYSRHQAMQALAVGYLLSWFPLGALTMCGLLLSAVVRNPGAAVAVGISSLFLVDFTKHLVGLDPYIFTRYFDYPWLNLEQMAQGMDYQWQPEVWRMLGLCGVSAVTAFIAGLIVFVKQDLNH
jgi:ABC-type transport system involved in multi-copper enzyme maturation permease subunit